MLNDIGHGLKIYPVLNEFNIFYSAMQNLQTNLTANRNAVDSRYYLYASLPGLPCLAWSMLGVISIQNKPCFSIAWVKRLKATQKQQPQPIWKSEKLQFLWFEILNLVSAKTLKSRLLTSWQMGQSYASKTSDTSVVQLRSVACWWHLWTHTSYVVSLGYHMTNRRLKSRDQEVSVLPTPIISHSCWS